MLANEQNRSRAMRPGRDWHPARGHRPGASDLLAGAEIRVMRRLNL